MRIILEGPNFRKSMANWFDATLAGAALTLGRMTPELCLQLQRQHQHEYGKPRIDLCLIVVVDVAGAPVQAFTMFLVRALTSLRAVRLLRAFRFCRGLQLLLKAHGWDTARFVLSVAQLSLILQAARRVNRSCLRCFGPWSCSEFSL